MGEIDHLRKLDRLDNLLLFLSSSLGIFFTIIIGFLGNLLEVPMFLFLIPPLWLGWLLPVYVGYWRGALVVDRVEERVRGWIYFFVGLTLYLIYTIFYLIVPKVTPLFQATWLYLLPPILLALSAYLFASFFSVRIGYKILRIFGKDITESVKHSFTFTGLSAKLQALLITVIYFGEPSIIYELFIIIFFAMGIIPLEIMARRSLP